MKGSDASVDLLEVNLGADLRGARNSYIGVELAQPVAFLQGLHLRSRLPGISRQGS